MVLAAEPPDRWTPAPIETYSVSARSASMSVMEPFTSASVVRKPSSWWEMTSTRAFPMPTTSRSCTSETLPDPHGPQQGSRNAPVRWNVVSDNPYRLPRTATPSRYDLLLAPDLNAATFAGSVDVAVDVHRAVDELVCNAVDLEVDEAWVTVGDERLEAVTKLDAATERLHLGLPRALEPGQATLHLRFRGVLNDLLRGFYRSTYTDDEGVARVIATTQMEATDCRRAFPCWDEPDFKAVLGVTLEVADDLLALSNAPERRRQPLPGGRVRIEFDDTMLMSTYLAAFVVGHLEATDPVDVDGVPLRVVHVPGKAALTSFALEVGAFSLRWFQEYYGIPYPEQKVDL